MSITAELLSQRLEVLSKLTPEDLEDMTLKALRKKISECGVKAVDRDGVEVSVHSAKKAEIIAAIAKITVKEKVVSYVVPELTTEDLSKLQEIGNQYDEVEGTDYSGFATYIYENLREYTKKRWDGVSQSFLPPDGTLAVLANSIAQYVERKHPDVHEKGETQLRHHTRLNARGAVLKGIEKYIETSDKDTWIYNSMVANLNSLKTHVFTIMKADSLTKKDQDVENSTLRSDNASTINITKLITHAHKVLSELSDKTSAAEWKEVSLALGIVTGRRLYAEIFCTAEFLKTGEYEVEFTGQSKTKGKSEAHYSENPSYKIPTLVKADLVIAALQWLGDKGKRVRPSDLQGDVQLARSAANKRYSKDVSKHIKSWIKFVDFLEVTEQPKEITPHTLRELYTLAASKAFMGFNKFNTAYAASILGHGKEDELTANRYQKDFKLSDDSVCKI